MNKKIKELTLIALFPALMGATSLINIPLGFLPPITLQTLFVILAGLILGPKNAFISMLIYLILGAIGIPVFSGGRGGLTILFGSTGGFLFGFLIIAFYIGYLKKIHIIKNKYLELVFISLTSIILLYIIGASYMAFIVKTNLISVLVGFLIYTLGDLIKALLACFIYLRLSTALKL